MIIFDENVDQCIIDRIKAQGFDVFSIRELNPGVSDREVIQLAKTKKGIIVTEDKDFGELVFSHNLKYCSVILLRYKQSDYEHVVKNIIKIVEHLSTQSDHRFFTVSKGKIRTRKM